MANFDIFVGRDLQLSRIKDIVEDPKPSTRMIVVDGVGGVGKTFLLQKLAREYEENPGYAVDYYDLAIHPPGNVREATHLAETLGWENFPKFSEKINDLASGIDITDVDLFDKEIEAIHVGIAELAHFLGDRKLLRLVDTLEASLPARSGEREFYQLASWLPNAVFIMAGRNAKSFLPAFQQSFGKDHVTYIELKGFSLNESKEFFRQIDDGSLINPKMRSKLHFLTDGSPILLSLATEWLQHDIPLPEMTKYSKKDLKSLPEIQLSSLKEDFRFELVDRVRRLRTPIDEAILYMAQITKRFNAQILSILLNVPLGEAQQHLVQISELSFVRYNPTQATRECRLHDEMRNLVIRYAWPTVDASGEMRQKITRQVIDDYYLPRIRRLFEESIVQPPPDKKIVHRVFIGENEWEQWRLEAECLHYYLKLSLDDGRAYFNERYSIARRNRHLLRIQFLIDELKASGSIEMLDFISIRNAEQCRLLGDEPQAQVICEQLLQKPDLTEENRVSVYNILGQIFTYRNIQKAEEHFRAALELAQKRQDKKTMGVLYNNLGQLYRNASQLDDAIRNYQAAIACSRVTNDLAIEASATNNLAFVYRLQSNLAEAESHCDLAMTYRKKLGLERDLAYSYLTKAEIARDNSDLESAEYYTKLALRTLDKIDDRRGQIMVYRFLANIERHRSNFEQSEAFLNKGIALAREIGDEMSLARLYHVYGQQQRRYALSTLKDYDQAETKAQVEQILSNALEHLKTSQVFAEKYGDQRLLSHNKLEMALILSLSRKDDDELHRLLEDAWHDGERLKDEVLKGHVMEVKGDLHLKEQRYSQAADQFGEAAMLMEKYPSRETNHFFDKMRERIMDIQLSEDGRLSLAKGMLEHLPQMTVNQKMRSLQSLCRRILE